MSFKSDFPLFSHPAHQNLVYLDSAATSQKPQVVIDALTNYYKESNANPGRGLYSLSLKSTELLEKSREVIASFFKTSPDQLVITRNATDAVNAIAYGWAEHYLKPNDLVVVSLMEHHANLVVWQQLAKRKKLHLEYWRFDTQGELDWWQWQDLRQRPELKLVAVTQVSNVLGTLNPIKRIARELVQTNRKLNRDARLLVDGAQSAPHLSIDFDHLGADFFVFSGHKMLGPMGVGGLLLKKELIDQVRCNQCFQPWLFGGGMIDLVTKEESSWNDDPAQRFQAGTADVASIVGLAQACQYLTEIGMDRVLADDQKLILEAIKQLQQNNELTILGPTGICQQSQNPPSTVVTKSVIKAKELPLARVGVVSFVHSRWHSHDLAQLLAQQGVAVRAGFHCAMPLHQHLSLGASLRISFNLYNDFNDLERFFITFNRALKTLEKIMR